MSGILSLPWWGYVLVLLGFTHITIISVTLYLHRYQAHRAVEMSPVLSHFFRFWLWLTTGMNTKEWVAVHRKHHDVSDTSEDPHSPWAYGIYKVLFLGAWLYHREAKKSETLRHYGQGTPDDWMEKNIYAYGYLGVGLLFAFNVLVLGVIPGILIWGAQMLWIPIWAAGVINGLGHWLGYRNFDTNEGSSNIVPWGIWIGGEELHNNHHAFANSAKFSQRPWEFDVGWLYIKIFEAFGLVKVNRVAPIACATVEKGQSAKLDIPALQVILANQQHVMSNYCNEVIRRVCSEEMEKVTGLARQQLRKIKRLALRDNDLFITLAQQKQIMEQHAIIQVVYQHKERLQTIWKKRAGTVSEKKALLEDLLQWQKEATASGIRALSEFADQLPSYQQRLHQYQLTT